MVTSIASIASSLKQQQLGMEVGVRLLQHAKNTSEAQGEALLKLLESAKVTELSLDPHLGTKIDVSG